MRIIPPQKNHQYDSWFKVSSRTSVFFFVFRGPTLKFCNVFGWTSRGTTLSIGRIAMFSYFRTVYGSRWIGFDGFFLNIRKGGKTWCFFFWLVDIPFWWWTNLLEIPFWCFFVESWVLGSVEVCLFFEGVVWCKDVGRRLKSMRCDFCIQCTMYILCRWMTLQSVY